MSRTKFTCPACETQVTAEAGTYECPRCKFSSAIGYEVEELDWDAAYDASLVDVTNYDAVVASLGGRYGDEIGQEIECNRHEAACAAFSAAVARCDWYAAASIEAVWAKAKGWGNELSIDARMAVAFAVAYLAGRAKVGLAADPAAVNARTNAQAVA